MSKRDEIANIIEDETGTGSREQSLQLADRILALPAGGAAMTRISADSLITTIKQKRDRAELLALVEARDAEIAAEAAAREREAVIERLNSLTYRSSWGETIEACIAVIRARQEPQP